MQSQGYEQAKLKNEQARTLPEYLIFNTLGQSLSYVFQAFYIYFIYSVFLFAVEKTEYQRCKVLICVWGGLD